MLNNVTLFKFKSFCIEIDDDKIRIFWHEFAFNVNNDSSYAMKLIDQIFNLCKIFNL